MLAAIILATPLSMNAKMTQTTSTAQTQQRNMTAEDLWQLGRIGTSATSPDGKYVVYQVSYYSVPNNNSQTKLFIQELNGKNKRLLTKDDQRESDAAWLGNKIVFVRSGEIWSMDVTGGQRQQLSHTGGKVEGFAFSPDRKKVVMLQSLPYHGTIKETPTDLPKATGMLITDMNYRHWDHYVTEILHPFIANVTGNSITTATDIMAGEPFEAPIAPFGGIEQIAWSPDSKFIAYTSRKKEGVQYAISTDTDIYLYEVSSGKTTNLCKP